MELDDDLADQTNSEFFKNEEEIRRNQRKIESEISHLETKINLVPLRENSNIVLQIDQEVNFLICLIFPNFFFNSKLQKTEEQIKNQDKNEEMIFQKLLSEEENKISRFLLFF